MAPSTSRFLSIVPVASALSTFATIGEMSVVGVPTQLQSFASCEDFSEVEPWPVLAGPHIDCGSSAMEQVSCGRLECQRMAEGSEADMYAYTMDGKCRVCYDGNHLYHSSKHAFVYRRPTAEGSAQDFLGDRGIRAEETSRYDDSQRWNWVRKHHGVLEYVRWTIDINKSIGHLPALPNLQKRLRNITMKAASNPCQADILSMAPMHSVGLGSRIHGMAEELLVAMYGNYTFAICEQVNSMTFIRDTFMKYFDTTVRDVAFPICTDMSACKPLSEETMLSVAQAGRQVSASLLHKDKRSIVLAVKEFLYPYIFHMNANTTAAVDHSLAQMGLKNQQYIGVHIRRGDKVKEAAPVDTSVYAAAAMAAALAGGQTTSTNASKKGSKKATVSKRITKVFLASDDPAETGKFIRAVNHAVQVVQQPPHSQQFYQSRDYSNPDNMLTLLTDIEALRRAEVFIGTASSNIGTLVKLLRGDHASLSLDMGGDWLNGAS